MKTHGWAGVESRWKNAAITQNYRDLVGEVFSEWIPREGRLLEIGASRGLILNMFPFLSDRLVQSDLSYERIKVNQEDHPGAQQLQLDAHYLPFGDETLSGVVAISTLDVLDDLPRATIEAYRVLKPGGRFIHVGLSEVHWERFIPDYDTAECYVIPRATIVPSPEMPGYIVPLVDTLELVPKRLLHEAGISPAALMRDTGCEEETARLMIGQILAHADDFPSTTLNMEDMYLADSRLSLIQAGFRTEINEYRSWSGPDHRPSHIVVATKPE